MKEYVQRAGNYIETNKFSYIIKDSPTVTIIFCKTDFLFQEFENLKNLNKKIILLTGNSDFPITEDHATKAPPNLLRLYGQNVLCNDNRFVPVPMGLESSVICRRGFDHGVYYDRSKDLQDLLISYTDEEKSVSRAEKFIYSNFSIRTNPPHRQAVFDFVQDIDFITSGVRKPVPDFHQEILNHKITLCPAGNGLDTHRLWEILYLNRIPLTIFTNQKAAQGSISPNYKEYSIYKKLYSKLPIIILDKIEDLKNKNLIEDLYNEVKDRPNDLAYFSNWVKIIHDDLNDHT